MNPEQLRRTVMRATIPRLAEYETLTMAQIARAAGIGEAELLAVFADKEAVMRACAATLVEAMTAVLDPAEEMREMGEIRTDQPLASRLVGVIDILDGYHRRIRVDLDELLPAGLPAAGAAETSGIRPLIAPDELRSFGSGSSEWRQAVARVLAPDERRLRLPAPILADAFVAMAFSGVRAAGPDQSPLPAARIVDLFLHGALNTG